MSSSLSGINERTIEIDQIASEEQLIDNRSWFTFLDKLRDSRVSIESTVVSLSRFLI